MKMPHADARTVPDYANDSWRTWLMTGIRRDQVDRRRVRGAHLGIKKMLIEGMRFRTEKPYTWKDFSDAMVRQSVGEAMQSLPYRDSQLIKLAYFGGMSNREIADHMQMPEGTVERRLRRGLDTISKYVERGRGFGQRLLLALMAWLSGRWVGDSMQHVVQAGAVAAATVIILTQPAAPSATADAGAMTVVPPMPSPTIPGTNLQAATPVVAAPAVGAPDAPVSVPPVQVPAVTLPVKLPPPPPLPVKVKEPIL